jgi:NAD(P)-dependent dehydrogenase (short-subunit alcohol dehydrogenase family)
MGIPRRDGSMGRVDGKVAIITGAASGMGACEAELFAQEGAMVVATDIQIEALEDHVKRIRDNGGQIISLRHDVTSEESWNAVIEKTIESYGQIDILVNNAGIPSKHKGILKVTLDEWNSTMSVNSTGVYLGMKSVILEMLKSGGGSIVNISSIAGIIGSSSSTAYTATKGAVRSLTKNVAIDYAKNNIRVNSVHPGFIVTPMIEEQLKIVERKAFIENSTPLPYLGEPIDIAYGVLYLASDEAKYVTGTELVIDGGYIAR